MKNLWIKKGMVIGVLALFLSFGIIQTLAHEHTATAVADFTQVQVDEYCADGTVATRYVPLNQDEIDELRHQLLKVGVEERFALLQSYGLIPAERTMKDLEHAMYVRAESLGIIPERVQKLTAFLAPIVKQRPPILLDFFSRVSTVHIGGGSLRLGLSALIGYLNFLRGWNLPKTDFFDVAWGLMGVVDSWGFLNHHSLVTFPGMMCLTGFVGYNIKLPLFVHNFWGYSAMTFAAGLGIHSVIWLYWLNQGS